MSDTIQDLNRPRAFPPVVLGLLVANGAIYLLQGAWGYVLESNFALWPLGGPFALRTNGGIITGEFHVWQLLTHSFLHGSSLHLFSNLFALWMFGMRIENLWGSARFLRFYVICVLSAALLQLLVTSVGVQMESMPPVPTVGASGGVFGILLAFGMMFPNERVVLLIPPIPMPAKVFVTLYGLFELFAGVTGSLSGIAHFAHLGGMIGGFLTIQYWRGRWPFGGGYR